MKTALSSPTPFPTSRIENEPPEEIQEQIRTRAYELYYARGAGDGHDLDDWLQAESEVTQKTKARAA